MVINHFDVFCKSIRPAKTDAPLIIDANTVLTSTIALKRFKTITGRNSQILKAIRDFELPQFPPGNLCNVDILFYIPASGKCLGVFASK